MLLEKKEAATNRRTPKAGFHLHRISLL